MNSLEKLLKNLFERQAADRRQMEEGKATAFITQVLKTLLQKTQESGLDVPRPVDKWYNPNPKVCLKFYAPHDILMANYMLNQGWIAGKLEMKNPFFGMFSLTPEGYDALFQETLEAKL